MSVHVCVCLGRSIVNSPIFAVSFELQTRRHALEHTLNHVQHTQCFTAGIHAVGHMIISRRHSSTFDKHTARGYACTQCRNHNTIVSGRVKSSGCIRRRQSNALAKMLSWLQIRVFLSRLVDHNIQRWTIR